MHCVMDTQMRGDISRSGVWLSIVACIVVVVEARYQMLGRSEQAIDSNHHTGFGREFSGLPEQRENILGPRDERKLDVHTLEADWTVVVELIRAQMSASMVNDQVRCLKNCMRLTDYPE